MPAAAKVPFSIRLRRRLRRAWRKLLEERSSPAQIGVAVFWGVVVGCSPFYGFQNLLAISTSTLLRLNRVAVVLAAQVTTPPLNLVLIFVSLQVGHLLRAGDWLAISFAEVRARPPREIAEAMATDFFIGSFVVGAVLGVVLGVVAARAVARSRREHDPAKALGAEERLALEDRLDFLPGWYRGYGGWKVKLDPVYPLALAALAGRKQVVDLGAGMGLLAALFAARQPEAKIRAVDWDGKKVAVATTVLADLPGASAIEGDARTFDVSDADGVAMIDVLHYLPVAEQREWLLRVARAVAEEATIVIRELDPTAQKGALAEGIDRWMVRLGWNKGAGVHAWPIPEVRALLEEEGFRVEVAPAGRGMFKANALVVARRP